MFDLTHIALFFICALTSAFTAGLGVGGGAILLVLLPNFLAPNVVIPIHGATQLMSNTSRLLFDWKTVSWSLVRPYVPGALMGGVLGYYLLNLFEFNNLPLILGVFILVCTWTDVIRRLSVLFGNMFLLGLFQTSASLFVGAVGLIMPPILVRQGLSRNEVISTQAAMVSFMHAFKVATYVAAGFAFREHWQLMVLMLAGSAFGSYAGRFLRDAIPEQRGLWLMKWLVTVLAMQLVLKYIITTYLK